MSYYNTILTNTIHDIRTIYPTVCMSYHTNTSYSYSIYHITHYIPYNPLLVPYPLPLLTLPTPYPGVIRREGPAQGGGEAGQRGEAQASDGVEGQRGSY